MLPLNTEPNRKILPFVPLSLNGRCSKMYPANALLAPPSVVFRIYLPRKQNVVRPGFKSHSRAQRMSLKFNHWLTF